MAVAATHGHATVEFRGPVRLGPGFVLDLPGAGTFVVGAGVDFRRGFVCEISEQGRVVIGDGTIFTRDVLVQCTTSIDIGRRCVFSQDVLLADGNHRYDDPDRHPLDQGYDFRPLVVGDGALVLAKCTILAPVGERAVVAAGSVVTRPVPPYTLVGGAPALHLRDLRLPAL